MILGVGTLKNEPAFWIIHIASCLLHLYTFQACAAYWGHQHGPRVILPNIFSPTSSLHDGLFLFEILKIDRQEGDRDDGNGH